MNRNEIRKEADKIEGIAERKQYLCDTCNVVRAKAEPGRIKTVECPRKLDPSISCDECENFVLFMYASYDNDIDLVVFCTKEDEDK